MPSNVAAEVPQKVPGKQSHDASRCQSGHRCVRPLLPTCRALDAPSERRYRWSERPRPSPTPERQVAWSALVLHPFSGRQVWNAPGVTVDSLRGRVRPRSHNATDAHGRVTRVVSLRSGRNVALPSADQLQTVACHRHPPSPLPEANNAGVGGRRWGHVDVRRSRESHNALGTHLRVVRVGCGGVTP